MATLSIQRPVAAGVAITFATPVGADKFLNSGKEYVHIENAGAGDIVVTFDSPQMCNFELDANAAHDLAVTVAAGAQKLVGPFSKIRFNDDDGYVNITYDTVADTRIAVVSGPAA